MENQKQIPDSFDFNDTDLDRPKQQQYVDGFYKGAIVKAKRHVAKSDNMNLKLSLRAVNAEGKLKGPSTDYYVTIPVPNPLVPGHAPYSDSDGRDIQFTKAREFIRAVKGSEALPAFPKKREGSGTYLRSTGSLLPSCRNGGRRWVATRKRLS